MYQRSGVPRFVQQCFPKYNVTDCDLPELRAEFKLKGHYAWTFATYCTARRRRFSDAFPANTGHLSATPPRVSAALRLRSAVN